MYIGLIQTGLPQVAPASVERKDPSPQLVSAPTSMLVGGIGLVEIEASVAPLCDTCVGGRTHGAGEQVNGVD
jgi:hypothetical protein